MIIATYILDELVSCSNSMCRNQQHIEFWSSSTAI